ncbi:hypothetical protein Chor_005937 [Crotalus horridus]
MACRLFEDKDHAAFYQKYRFSLQENLQAVVLAFLEKKLGVDVGCGSGQNTLLLAKYFEKVVGTDVSEAQIEEAKRAAHPPNVSYFACPAEELPFEDNSVDLITAFTAFHTQLLPYAHEKIKFVLDDYKAIFDALPFQDKEKITDIVDKIPKSVSELLGYLQSFSMYQTFQKAQPEAAKSLIQNTERRILETMGVSSNETMMEIWTRQVCILGSKSCKK